MNSLKTRTILFLLDANNVQINVHRIPQFPAEGNWQFREKKNRDFLLDELYLIGWVGACQNEQFLQGNKKIHCMGSGSTKR